MILLELFWAFFQIGLFSIGGGQAALPLIQNNLVTAQGWLSSSEFADIVTIAESTPGPIAINAASFVGIKLAGPLGAVFATLGFVVPTVAVVLLLSLIYDRFRKSKYVSAAFSGLRPAVLGMIAAAAVTLASLTFFDGEAVNVTGIILTVFCFLYLRVMKLNPVFVILGAGVVGGLVYTLAV